MKYALNSIRFRSWLLYVSFALLIIGFLYFFQVLSLPANYERMKINETASAVKELKDVWNNDPTNISKVVSEYAHSKKMYIEISDVNRIFVRLSQLDKNNKEVEQIIRRLDQTKMDKLKYGNDVYYTSTLPRSHTDSKAIIMTAVIAQEGKNNGVFQTNGEVRIYIYNYLEPIGSTAEIINNQLTFASVVIIFCAFILSVFFSNSFTKPIVEISKSALKLPQGKFHMKKRKHQFSEINDLTEALNSASDEIAKTDDLRKELMANISHDLRTPLTMIKAYAEMIRDLSGDIPEKREKHLQVIIDETNRLSSLVTDVLDLSKLQSGVAEMNYSVIDFSEHLTQLVTRFTLLDEVKDYHLDLNSEKGIFINADITKIEQVVYNFINNALTYTGDDRTVKIRLYRKENGIARFEVSDSGVGIDEENLKYIWERYYRIKNVGETHQRAKKGSGLGLSIVKGVLEMHKFRYGADSTVNVGSTFWFEFDEYKEKPAEITASKKTKRNAK